MTNYNERLDEIVRSAYSGEISWIHDQLDGTSLLEEALDEVEENVDKAKQAITSLTKELVAEAKPFDYVPVGHEPDACLNHEKYTSACCGCRNQRARVHALDEFEQNLLKALEEK